MTDRVHVLSAEISVASGFSETFWMPSKSVSGTPYSLSYNISLMILQMKVMNNMLNNSAMKKVCAVCTMIRSASQNVQQLCVAARCALY